MLFTKDLSRLIFFFLRNLLDSVQLTRSALQRLRLILLLLQINNDMLILLIIKMIDVVHA